MTIFFKGVLSGLLSLTVAWIIILSVHLWRVRIARDQRGIGGLGAAAGGWVFLLQMPLVIVLLAGAFGLGLYLATRSGY